MEYLLSCFQTSFSVIIFLALLKFGGNNSYLAYDSNIVSNTNYISMLLAKLAAFWLYWFGGSAYVLVFGLVLYHLPKNFISSWQLKLDRLLGFILVIFASNVLCQIYQVGNYGNLPGGGRLGVWCLQLIALPELIWLVIAQSVLVTGLVLYSRFCFMPLACYLLVMINWLFRPVLIKLNALFNKNIPDNQISVQGDDLQQSVLEHEYQELLNELDPQVHQDLFWQTYFGASESSSSRTGLDEDMLLNSMQNNIEQHEPQLASLSEFGLSGEAKPKPKIVLPVLEQLSKPSAKEQKNSRDLLDQQAQVLINKLKRFGILGQVSAIKPGPVITLFEFTPAEDAKISKIVALEHDLALALQTASLRIIAPVPGKPVVGFEVANLVRESVMLCDVLQDERFVKFVDNVKNGFCEKLEFQIPIAIGKDTIGQNVLIDLVKTPHLLVAGSTGSGKSVALNSILVSMLCANPPERLRLILIDPKRLEFARYAGIGHLLFPIVCDAKRTLLVLRWVVQEMERRYEQMAQAGVRNLADYNRYLKKQSDPKSILPYLVIVIDELADLMMTAGKDVEDLIIRIAQMARAAGIHMIVATQRPSVDVVTGLIKVNFPSRISFRVASKADSRTILDCNGADTLLGSGDMLMLDAQLAALKRAHGAYVTDEQVNDVVKFILENYETNYLNLDDMQFCGAAENDFNEDEILSDVLLFLKDCDEVSISLLQRRFRIGYNRSARIMNTLESHGYVLTLENSKMRKVLKDRLDI